MRGGQSFTTDGPNMVSRPVIGGPGKGPLELGGGGRAFGVEVDPVRCPTRERYSTRRRPSDPEDSSPSSATIVNAVQRLPS
jgi:hypothetical protein